MKKKKIKAYLDIMDIDEEFKIYKNVCKGKSKKIKYYSQWRDHILVKISDSSNERIYNFKRFCLNRKRPIKISGDLYIQICLAFVAVYVPSVIDDPLSKMIFIALTFSVITFILGKNIFEDNIKNAFYEDIIEIIDDFQMNKGVDPRCQTATPKPATKKPLSSYSRKWATPTHTDRT